MSPPSSGPPWLLLFHQLPPKPAYLRVKVWRKLAAVGAVAIKHSVYAMPNNDQALEHLQWVLKEIRAGGGEGSVCAASLVDGLSDAQVIAQFQSAREADYAALAREAVRARLARRGRVFARRLERRLAEIAEIDFFAAPGRQGVEAAIDAIDAGARPGARRQRVRLDRSRYRGRTWTTRAGIFIDRIASAWLIRSFIDPDATFRWLAAGQRRRDGEIAFDMPDGEFTHDGERCTFETLVERFALDLPGLRQIGEVVHDIDCKDQRFARPETPGVAAVITGLAAGERSDERRLARGAAVFSDLLTWFARRTPMSDRRAARAATASTSRRSP